MTWTDPNLIGGLLGGACLAFGGFGIRAMMSKNGRPRHCVEHGELLASLREMRVVLNRVDVNTDKIFERVERLEQKVGVLEYKTADDGR